VGEGIGQGGVRCGRRRNRHNGKLEAPYLTCGNGLGNQQI
jgi:hypothetical protein